MDMNDFERDLCAGEKFWLGPIREKVVFQDFQFLRYREKDFSGGSTHGQETGETCWSIYWNGKSIGQSARDFDTALALVLAHKYLGPNSQAGALFMKMLAKE